ncbi:chitin deacetylase [Mortierella sp. GBA30]|nr:chitin deacetylase [Mortierella sp. GBA30]
MIRLLAPPSIFVIVFTLVGITTVTAFSVSNYPAPKRIPSIYTPQVQQWLKEIDLTDAPDIPLRVGRPPACDVPPLPAASDCDWSCTQCAEKDIIDCGIPNTWGVTFDDGPTNSTPPLLDFLKANKLPATFFVMGSNVIQNPDVLKREVDEGHHLASHTWSHHALTTLSNEEIVAEMKWTEQAVFDITGLKMKYMRPPYGDINNRVRFVLHKLGYIPVDWSAGFDTQDWDFKRLGETVIVSTFTATLANYTASNKTKGFYCLEHDLNDETVGIAQKLLPAGQAHKINFATVATCEGDPQPYQNASMMRTSDGVVAKKMKLALAFSAVSLSAVILNALLV